MAFTEISLEKESLDKVFAKLSGKDAWTGVDIIIRYFKRL